LHHTVLLLAYSLHPAWIKQARRDKNVCQAATTGTKLLATTLRMSFSRLPAELQIEVFSYLENTDLKAVRSVNSSCRDNASPHLFRSIIACARYQAMGAFQNVALHPVYQKYVKEIVFDVTAYSATIAKHERAYRTYPGEASMGWARRARWKRYQALFREQEGIKEGVLLQTIARALEWMPHVESIVYSSHPLQVPVEKEVMKDILERGLFSSAWGNPSSQHSTDGIQKNAFHHLIGAICIAQYSTIREFRVKQLDHDASARTWHGPWLSLGEFHFEEPSHLEAGKYFFRNLRKIELDLDMNYGEHECLINLQALLAEAKNLCHLRLYAEALDAWFEDEPSLSPFSSLGLTTEWPELRSIDLGRILATEDELRGLIHRVKSTIISMKFTKCIITSGKWSNLTDEVVDNTKICTFVLDRVHEEFVAAGVPYRAMPPLELDRWTYEGQIRENEQGERYFWERPGKSVYAWQSLTSDEAGSSVVG
jgi:hypothetical protein